VLYAFDPFNLLPQAQWTRDRHLQSQEFRLPSERRETRRAKVMLDTQARPNGFRREFNDPDRVDFVLMQTMAARKHGFLMSVQRARHRDAEVPRRNRISYFL
jgi:hypothetical protein